MSFLAATMKDVPREFVADELNIWKHVIKLLIALYAAAWFAMLFELEQPSTSMITVALLMHPQSGMVLAKSFYRAIGTVCGCLVGILLIGLFGQQPEWFLTCLAVWIGICAAGAVLYRNFMSYGFVLSGYTAAIVTMPVINNPTDVFDSAVMRLSEVMLGILVSGIVADILWPDRMRASLRATARNQFDKLVGFVRSSMLGEVPRTKMEEINLDFVRSSVAFEDLRASAIFEDPEVRARSQGIRVLNQQFMDAATTFQSLHHFINRLLRNDNRGVAAALFSLYRPLGESLATYSGAAQSDIRELHERLIACRRVIAELAATLRSGFDGDALVEFDVGSELVARITDELAHYAETESSLRATRVKSGGDRVRFLRSNDYTVAFVTFLRTTLAMGAVSAFWVESAWPSGANALLNAVIFCALYAAAPTPVKRIAQLWYGFALGSALGLLCLFGPLPNSEGFSALIAATAAPFIFGAWLTARSQFAGMGLGCCVGMINTLALNNAMSFDFAASLNAVLASLIGVAFTALAFVVIPSLTGSAWQSRQQLRRLREHVALAVNAPLRGLSERLESAQHDLLHQAAPYLAQSEDSARFLAWALAVQESARMIVDLRVELASGANAELGPAIERALQAIAKLYRAPSRISLERGETALASAIEIASDRDDARSTALLRRLHALRWALRDDRSVFAGYRDSTEFSAQEAAHAA